jgi:hypothetical protein
MANNRQLAYHPIDQNYIKPRDKTKLAILQNRRAVKRFIRQQTVGDRIFQTITIASVLMTTVFGIGALGCWGREMIDTHTKSVVLSQQRVWQTRKQICLGWMLVGLSSFLGSTSLAKKTHRQKL